MSGGSSPKISPFLIINQIKEINQEREMTSE